MNNEITATAQLSNMFLKYHKKKKYIYIPTMCLSEESNLAMIMSTVYLQFHWEYDTLLEK